MKYLKFSHIVCVLFFIFLISDQLYADWVIQVSTGSAHSFKSSLDIKQNNHEDLHINAKYETRAWETMAPYYDLKIGKWYGNHAIEFESLHHKLYLKNKPEEVDKFQISHGYNLNTVNYATQLSFFILRTGIGFVMTHPETRIRNMEKEDDGGLNGFYISGVTFQAAVEKRYFFKPNWFLSLEGKWTGSYASIPIADGTADVPNSALHGLFGFGYQF